MLAKRRARRELMGGFDDGHFEAAAVARHCEPLAQIANLLDRYLLFVFFGTDGDEIRMSARVRERAARTRSARNQLLTLHVAHDRSRQPLREQSLTDAFATVQ